MRPVSGQLFQRSIGHSLQTELPGRKGGCLVRYRDALRPVISASAPGLDSLEIPDDVADDHLATSPTARVCIARGGAQLPNMPRSFHQDIGPNPAETQRQRSKREGQQEGGQRGPDTKA